MKMSWKDKKEIICLMVKLLSDKYGGDDPVFLKRYCDDVIKKYIDNLIIPLTYFKNLCNDYAIRIEKSIPIKKEHFSVCKACGYRPVFCECKN